MTDKEIEKGLKACVNGVCKECPYHEYDNCIGRLPKDSLAYIKRLKAREEKIRKEAVKEALIGLYNREEMGYDVIKWYAKAYFGVEVEE